MNAVLPELSVVTPVYGAASILPELHSRLVAVLHTLARPAEIIYVVDGSPDSSWQVLTDLLQSHNEPGIHVKAINLSRNFGQHAAITCGLAHSRGRYNVVMDCDLQDLPEEIPALLRRCEEGRHWLVLALRVKRNDSALKKFFSGMFYRTFQFFTDSNYDGSAANFGVYHRKVVEAYLAMGDRVKVFPLMVHWLGFKPVYMPVKHGKRHSGKSSYNFKKLVGLALNIILGFSTKPLRLITGFGLILALLGFLYGTYTLIMWSQGNIAVMGYTSLIISIWFLSGVLITTVGLTGLYVGQTFEAVKNRPVFVEQELIEK